MFKFIAFVLTVLFLVFGVTIGVFNPQLVSLDLIWFKQELALSILMAMILILGMLLGASTLLFKITKLKWQLSKQKRVNQKQSDQILQLKKTGIQALSKLDKNRQALLGK